MDNKKVIVQMFARDFQEPPRISQMCRDLSEKGFIVYRILFKKNKIKRDYKENYKTIIVKKNGFLTEKPSNNITILDLIFFGIIGAGKIKKINKKNKIDIMHCHRHSSLIPAFISKFMGVKAKIVLDYHDPWSGESTILENNSINFASKMKIKLFHMFERFCFKYVNHIVVVSEPQKKFLKNSYKLKDEYFTRVTNSAAAANNRYFNPKKKNKDKFGWEKKKVVLFTGSIVPYFGLDLLIDSIPFVIKKIPNAFFAIKIAEEIKDKGYYNELLKKIEENGIKKNVEFISEWMADEKYAEFVCSADLGAICHQKTLLTETADPDKLYEYLAAGLPIVATDLEIMKRFVKDKKNGFIVKNNPKNIAEAIIKILSNEKLRRKMSFNSRKMRFDWKDDFNKLLNTYNKLIKK
ncbi:MAG: glycosyltransferase [Nanoarchaeota archaeon]